MTFLGITISTQTLFFLFIVTIGILMLVFFRNRRYNIVTIRAISKELEAALQPVDQTYTWLGGAIGFTADFKTEAPLRKAEATVTMLSRQSLLFYPISKIMFGTDRLFVVLYPFERFRREAHVLEKWYYTLRLKTLEHADSFHKQEVTLNGNTFCLFSADKAGVEKLIAWMERLPAPELIKHVALMPENGSIYLYMNPQPGHIADTVKELITLTPQR